MQTLTALVIALQVASPQQFDLRCSESYSDPSAPLIDNDNRYSIDLDRGVWCKTRDGCEVNPIYEANGAVIRLTPQLSINRATGVAEIPRFSVVMQCRKVEYTPLPTSQF